MSYSVWDIGEVIKKIVDGGYPNYQIPKKTTRPKKASGMK
jgi:hypothetical protein